MAHVKINQVSSWREVNNPPSARIHTDADGGVTGSQSPVQSGAAEGIQA
jgi:hypothetical protein